jgi:hypothetical protein
LGRDGGLLAVSRMTVSRMAVSRMAVGFARGTDFGMLGR